MVTGPSLRYAGLYLIAIPVFHSMEQKRTGGFRKPQSGGSRPQNNRRFGSASSGRPSFGNHAGRPFNRPSQRGGRKILTMDIDPARLIVKATVTEETEEFIPTHTFADFALDARLHKTITAKGYVTPTPIQDKAIPHGIIGKDVVGIAETGTGKTAAFLLPLIQNAIANKHAQALIMVPTRELAVQIEEEFRAFSRGLGLYACVLIGGAPMGKQLRELRYFNHFIIGTPGRIKDMIERGALNITSFEALVLDEADRMLDMGFIHDMRKLVGMMPKDRQTMFFSATMTREIDALVHEFLHEPVKISVKKQATSKNVDQDIIKVPRGGDKLAILCELLSRPGFDKVIIFGRTKHGVERLAKELETHGIRSDSIHGNKNHNQRQKALSLFKTHHVKVLVATDVAARGLDISGVSHVINFDMPATYEDYIHRIGRTGRAGKKGSAITFVEGY